MQIIDNINHIVKNDLQDSIQPGSKLSIAAACFSIYAYQPHSFSIKDRTSPYSYTFPYCSNNVPYKKSPFFCILY